MLFDYFPAPPHTLVLCILQISLERDMGKSVFTLIETAIQHGSQITAIDFTFWLLTEVTLLLKPILTELKIKVLKVISNLLPHLAVLFLYSLRACLSFQINNGSHTQKFNYPLFPEI